MATVVGTIKLPSGAAYVGTVTFTTLTMPAVIGGAVVAGASVRVVTDSGGEFSLALEAGTYRVTIPGSDAFEIVVPSGVLTYDIADITSEPIGGDGSDVRWLTREECDARYLSATPEYLPFRSADGQWRKGVLIDRDGSLVISTAEVADLPVPDAPGAVVSDQELREWTKDENWTCSNVVRNGDGVILSMNVLWRDGSAGAFSALSWNDYGLQSFAVTHANSGKTVTVPAPVLDGDGNVVTEYEPVVTT